MVEQPPCKRQVRGSTPLSGSKFMSYALIIRILFLFSLLSNFILYFLGHLRQSVIYDYIAYWPFSLLPLFLYLLFYRSSLREAFKSVYLILPTIFFIIFPILHLSIKPSFLPTFSIPTEINRINEIDELGLSLIVDTRGSLEIDDVKGSGYLVDILNSPGSLGFPEVIETNIIKQKKLLIREMEVDSLLKTKGWKLYLGTKNSWDIDIFSIESKINLQDLDLRDVKISGTGQIYLDEKNLFNSFTISGNFTVFVPKNLPLLVEGNATVPDRWIEATIGYLSQTNQSYKVKIVVLNDSEVTFEDYEEQQ